MALSMTKSCERNLRNRFDNPNYVSWNRLLIEDIMYCKMRVLDTLLTVDLPDSTDLQWFTVWTVVDVQILQSKLRQAICWGRIAWLARLQCNHPWSIVCWVCASKWTLQEQSFKHKWIENEDADSFLFALMCCHIIFIGHSYVEAQRI
jgi:hypothetical protein